MFLHVFHLIHCMCDHMLMCFKFYMCEFVQCICTCVCSTYRKCGQECVSVFSLVNVVKRGLISSNVIHTVTSHYFHSAGLPPNSLYPSCPLCPLFSLSPFFSLFCPFYLTPSLSTSHDTEHFCTSPMVDIPNSLVFTPRARSHHQIASFSGFTCKAKVNLLWSIANCPNSADMGGRVQ